MKIVVIYRLSDSEDFLIELSKELMNRPSESLAYLMAWDDRPLPLPIYAAFDHIYNFPWDSNKLAEIFE